MTTANGFRQCWGVFRLVSKDDRGFTLIEVVAAIAIVAVLAGVIFQIISGSIRSTHRAQSLANAGALAQSLLARVGNEIPLREGQLDVDTDLGLHWHLQMRRYGDAEDRKQWPVAAYIVTAEVTLQNNPSSRSVTLTTLRLGAKETAP
jgi:general secretion pathway protein I